MSESRNADGVDLVVKADLMVPMTSENVIHGAAVAVSDGEIVYAGDAAGCSDLRAASVIEAPDAVLLPGLVNAHTHVADHIYGTLVDEADISESLYEVIFPLASTLDDDLQFAAARLGLWDALRSGVSTVCDLNMYADATARAAADLGARAVVAEKVVEYRMDTPPNFDRSSHTFTMNWDRAEAERLLQLGVDLVERWRDHPLISPAIGPHAPDHLSTEMLLECAKAADAHGVKLLPHIAQTTAEGVEIRRRGYDGSIRYLDSIGFLSPAVHAAHMAFVDDEEIAIAAERGISMSFNPIIMLACRCFPPIGKLMTAGIRIGFGTDCFSMDVLADMRPAIYAANFLSENGAGPLRAYDVLRMATIGGAEAIGLGDRIGTIEAGKRADLLLLDLRDPQLLPVTNVIESVVYYGAGQNVTHTIVDGAVVYERGGLTLASEDEIVAAGREASAEWLRRNRPRLDASTLAARIDERAYGRA